MLLVAVKAFLMWLVPLLIAIWEATILYLDKFLPSEVEINMGSNTVSIHFIPPPSSSSVSSNPSDGLQKILAIR